MRHLMALCGGVMLAASPLYGQAVQLPTQQVFSVGTTVMVPDRGGTYLGGVKRLSEGRTSRGVPLIGQLPGVGRLFKNVGIGRETSNRGAHVNAYIIDLKEQEETLLRQASPQARAALKAGFAGKNRPADFLSENVARPARQKVRRLPDGRLVHSGPPPSRSKRPTTLTLEQIREQNQLARAKQNSDAMKFFEKGQEAEADGKLSVAKLFYQMAARRAKGTEFYDRVAARLHAVSNTSTLVKR